MEVLQNPTIQLPCILEIPFLSKYLGELKIYDHTKSCAWIFIGTLFTKAKEWKPPKCPSTDKLIKFHVFIQYMHQQGWTLKRYIKWKKSGNKQTNKKTSTYLWFHLYAMFRKGKSTEMGKKLGLPWLDMVGVQ